MAADIIKLSIITVDYSGADRRYRNERRVALDRRGLIRFDMNGGDRRSGFSRRHSDEDLCEQDFL